MRIHTRIVLDMESLEVLHEEGYDYYGPVEMCKGGGGSSGQVGYPAYVERIHEDWLEGAANDTISDSVTDVMNDALGNSPYALAAAYDPDADIAAYIAAVGDLDTVIDAFIGTLDLTMNPVSMPTISVTIPSEVTEAAITTDTAKLEAQLDSLKTARLTGAVIPRFEAGMRDINAVVSSAFVIGRAVIESDADAEVTRDTASHSSKLRIAVSPTAVQVADTEVKKSQLNIQAADSDLKESHLDLQNREFVLKAQNARMDAERVLSQLMVEAYRIKIVAKKEQSDSDQDYDVADAKWDLETFQYGANVMASVAGGTAMAGEKKITPTSVIGGALSGAAAGAMVGLAGGPFAPISVTAGAIVGGLLGLGAGLLG